MDENASQYKNRMEYYLQRDFVGTNILSSLRYRFKFLGYYKNKYEWISHIDSTRKKNILTINIKGKVPDLYYSIGGVKYAQIIDKGNAVYQLTGGFDILSGSIPVLDMLTSSKLVETGFSVMFQGLSAEALVRQIQIIHNSIAIYRSMQYIPGGQKLILSNKQGGHFYFDLRKNMYEQLAKYRMINGTGVLIRGDVDLGTMDDLIFY
ncbi:MAG TPA: hypothetical protein PK048_04255 [Candidatus Absconditabacterales bacterium]|nr:hypothetical protein [Candidatus Absconditabacterales bacterium]